MPRELLAQSIVLRQLGRTEDANAVTGRFPEPPPADIRSLVNDAKLAYRAGQFSESRSFVNIRPGPWAVCSTYHF